MPTDPIKATAARFASDTTNHAMAIAHDDGLYRHLRFAPPDGGFYWFDLVTWPGRLAVTGGYGDTFVFARDTDMFTFFRGKGHSNINPGYWAEKVQDGRDRCSDYSIDKFQAAVAEEIKEHEGDYPGLGKAIEYALSNDYNHECEEGAREFLRDFTYTTAEGAKETASARAVWERTGNTADWKIFQESEMRNTFHFVDAWEWDLTDWSWQYLWACHAIVFGIAQYDKAKAETAVAA